MKPALSIIPLVLSIVGCSPVQEATESQISECKNLIYSHNRYEPKRMEYVKMKSDDSIIIKYHRTTSDGTWTLRCLNGNPQVWAKGAQTWIDI